MVRSTRDIRPPDANETARQPGPGAHIDSDDGSPERRGEAPAGPDWSVLDGIGGSESSVFLIAFQQVSLQ